MRLVQNQISKVREETVNGVKFLVAPVILIKEGVLNGEYVSEAEISAHYVAWNGSPFVIDHPKTKEGIHISANAPQILADAMAGRVFDARMDDGALKGEVWIDILLAQELKRGEEVIKRLTDGEPLEVSTAYFRDREAGSGQFNGDKYEATAKNLRPDHLAALLDVKGACSWADGCGVPRTNEEVSMPFPNEHAQRIKDPKKFIRIRRENDKFGAGIHAIWGVPEGKGGVELQSVRFDKMEHTEAEAKTWLKDHDHPTSGFEPASKPVGQESRIHEALNSLAQALGLKMKVEAKPMDELIKQIVASSDLTVQDLEGLNEDMLKKLVVLLSKKSDADAKVKADADAKAKVDADAKAKADADAKAKKKADGDSDDDDGEPAANEPCPELQDLAKAIGDRGGVEAVFALIDGVQAGEDGRKAKVVADLAANELCAFDETQLKALEYDTLVTLRKSLMPTDYAAQGGGARSSGEVEVTLPQMFE